MNMNYLYKYRSLSEHSSHFVQQILLNDELYFPRPKEFNDPFDCSPITSLEASDDEFSVYLDGLYQRKVPHLSRADRQRSVSQVLNDPSRNHRSKKLFDTLSKGVVELVNSAGVLSLSAKNDHILMWSHYADSHRGICLRFQASSSTPFFGRAQRVLYQIERPILNLIRDTPEVQVDKTLLTKADFWSYEEEWRIVEHDAGPGIHKFPAKLLDGIILGARISPEDRQRVLAWVFQRKEKIEVLQAQFDIERFRIKILRHTPSLELRSQ